jgi:hypothetical protein
LVNSEKNKAVYESVEELKREGGAGYTDPGLVLTWDGDLSGAINNEESLFVKVYDKCMDLTKVSSLSIVSPVFPEQGEAVAGPEYFTAFKVEEEDAYFLNTRIESLGDLQLGVASIPEGYEGFSEGVYILYVESLLRISKITFAETVHPIDPKFLPEGSVGHADPGLVLTWDGDTSGAN